MNPNETLTEILERITTALEEHKRVLQTHRASIEDIYGQVKELAKKVEKSEISTPVNSDDIEFLADITARLQVIGDTIKEKKGFS